MLVIKHLFYMFSLFPVHGVLEQIGLILVPIAVLVEISDKSFKNEFLQLSKPGTGNEFTSISVNLRFFAEDVGYERLTPFIGVVNLVTDLQKSCGFSFCNIKTEN